MPRSTCWSPASTRASRSTTRWPATRASPRLEPRDRAFVRLLLATTLRRLGEIDEVLGALIERPFEGANAAGRQVLRLGAAQLLFLGTPAHAAVDTSVRLVVDAGLPHLKGLANAVLRRVAREGVALLGDRDPARLNTPQWLWQSWAATYGEEATRAIAAAHLIEAPLDLTPRADAAVLGGSPRRRAAADRHASAAPTGGAIAELPGFAEGAWWVQDAAATLPARLLGDVAGKRVADLCAAPGGKTLQLCAAGAQVTAVDISAPPHDPAGREPGARRARRRAGDRRRRQMDAGGEVRRRPARRALLRHRHAAAPSRHRLAEGRGRCRAASPSPRTACCCTPSSC